MLDRCDRCDHPMKEHDHNDLNCETCTVAGGACAREYVDEGGEG